MSELAAALSKAQGNNDARAEGAAIRSIIREKTVFRGRGGDGKAPMLRFFEKIAFGSTECWHWVGSLVWGYGALGRQRAHRVSYRYFKGDIPRGIEVMHSCDNPSCVNPDHLSLGTHADNMRDCAKKGRIRTVPKFGESNPMAKLTLAAVRQMRKARKTGATYKKIAKDFGVTAMTAYRAVTGQNWSKDV